MSETFTFAQLNFSEDENQRHRQIRNQRKKQNSPTNLKNSNLKPRRSTSFSKSTKVNDSPSQTPSHLRYSNTSVRSSSMSLFVPPKLISHPTFDPEKYIQTPRGFIYKSIFSVNRTTLNSFSNPRYITDFPCSVVREASNVISESDSVLNFVLDHLKQLPCDVPIRWGVLFNLKFRRIFQCLDVEKWIALSKVLERHGYAKSEKLNIYLLDPSNITEYADLFNDLSETPQTQRNSPNTLIDPFQTPRRDPDSHFVFDSRTRTSLNTPVRPPEIPVDGPAVTPVPRAHNDSIYAIKYRNLSDPALESRFRPHLFESPLRVAIYSLFRYADEAIEIVFKQLGDLPVNIPLRWGCIYNKHLRVRRQTNVSEGSIISLAQWKEVKSLLKQHGYLEDKTVINCSILKNK